MELRQECGIGCEKVERIMARPLFVYHLVYKLSSYIPSCLAMFTLVNQAHSTAPESLIGYTVKSRKEL